MDLVDKNTIARFFESKYLNDPIFTEHFSNYLSSVFQLERFAFLQTVNTYEATEQDQLLGGNARNLFNQFLESGADMDIGIEASQREEIKSQLAAPTRDMFNNIKISIQAELKNSLPQFLASSYYEDYVTAVVCFI